MNFDVIYQIGNREYTNIEGMKIKDWEEIKDIIMNVYFHSGNLRISRIDNSTIEFESNGDDCIIMYIPPYSDEDEVPDVMTITNDSAEEKMVNIGGNLWDSRMTTKNLDEVWNVIHGYIFQTEALEKLS